MGEQRNKKISEEDALKEAEKMLDQLKEKKDESGKESEKKEKKDETGKKKEGKAKIRSQKYKNALLMVDRTKKYPIHEALELVKKTAYTKFPGSVEVHIKLEKLKKGDSVRGLIQLPHGNGKEINAAVLDEKLVEEILKNKKTDFDILLASPEMMPKIARVAKILGPQGKMPNPKSGTVTSDPKKSLEEIKKGRTEYKADKQGIIHLMIGKTDWNIEKLEDNFKALMTALIGKKLQGVAVCATMGPGIKVAI